MKENKGIRGYKVFNPDWTCRDFHYEVGGIYEENLKPKVCSSGFHYCENAADCFHYYGFNPKNKVAEVIALGDVDSDGTKSCTNKIQIVREIPWEELLRIVNTGKGCSGLCNTGDRNTGDSNTGDRNTGNRNTGDSNTGDRNTGDRNTGDWNTGNRNTGDWNTGNWNTGNFCTITQNNIMFFNKPSNWSYDTWVSSKAKKILSCIPKSVLEWIPSSDMTEEEKLNHPEHETTGGYLKELSLSEGVQTYWDSLTADEKACVRSLPNFDPDIFAKCTGIKPE